MKTLAEIEKIKDKLAAEHADTHSVFNRELYGNITFDYRSGFDACFALMLEREKVAKYALKAIVEEFEVDWAESQQYAKEALEKLK